MNPCTDIEPLLALYDWGATDGAERDACDHHLAQCPACLSRYLAFKRVREDAGAFDERPAPAMRDRLRARVARRAPPKRPVWFAVAAAAAAAIAVAVAARLMTHAPPPPPLAGPSLLIDSAPASEDLL